MMLIGDNMQKLIGIRTGTAIQFFFHAAASARRKVNHISSLQDDSGTKVTDIQV
jgi:hypothetical protein